MNSPIVTPNAVITGSDYSHYSCAVIFKDHFTVGMGIHSGIVSERHVNEYLDTVRNVEGRYSAPCRYYLGGAFGPSTTIDPVTRKAFSNFFHGPERSTKVSALVENSFHRGIITALAWLGVDISASNWSDAPAALDRLGLPRDIVGQNTEILAVFRGLAVYAGVDEKVLSRW